MPVAPRAPVQIITTNLGLSESDRPRLVVVIWMGPILHQPHTLIAQVGAGPKWAHFS